MSETVRKTNQKRIDYIRAIVATYGGTQMNYSRKELRVVSDTHGWKWIPNWITHDQARRVSRGVFSIPEAAIMPAEEDGEVSTKEITENSPAPAVVEIPDVVVETQEAYMAPAS